MTLARSLLDPVILRNCSNVRRRIVLTLVMEPRKRKGRPCLASTSLEMHLPPILVLAISPQLQFHMPPGSRIVSPACHSPTTVAQWLHLLTVALNEQKLFRYPGKDAIPGCSGFKNALIFLDNFLTRSYF